MTVLKHSCETCDSKFSISYDEMNCDDAPSYCPFCSSYLIQGDSEWGDDEEED